MSVAFELVARSRVRVRGDIPTPLLRTMNPDTSVLESARAVVFDAADYAAVLAAANAHRPLLCVSPVPPCVLAIVFNSNSESTFDYERDVDAKLRSAALPFQEAGIRRGLALGARVFFADEMGLGKTLQALGVLSAVLKVKGKGAKGLILAPTSLCEHWVREVHKWTSLRAVRVKDGKRPVPFAEADVVVGSVDLLKNVEAPAAAAVSAMGWAIVVCDESHGFKNKDSARSKELGPVMKRAEHLVLISGTPQLAMPCELFVQMDVMLLRTFMAWRPFTLRYCEGHVDARYGCWDTRGASHTAELATVLDAFMVRRLARDVLTDLPPLSRDVVRLELPPHDLVAMKAIEAELASARAVRNASGDVAASSFGTLGSSSSSGSGSGGSKAQKRAKRDCDAVKILMMRWWRETAVAKLGETVAYVAEEVARSWAADRTKTIVFCHHEVMRTALMAALGAGAVQIHGGTPAVSRQGIIDRVASATDDSAWVAVLSLTACSTGLSVVPAVRRVIFAESHWTPSLIMQAEKRAHRIGCTGHVRVTFVEAEGSIDSYIASMNAKKLQVNNECIGSGSLLSVSHRSERAHRGHQFVKYGVGTKCADVHTDALPLLAGESQHAWVRRVCVGVDAADVLVNALGKVDAEVFAVNALNAPFASKSAKSKRGGWRNLDEWCDAAAPFPVLQPATQLWLLTDAPLCETLRMRSLPSSFERAEAAGRFDTCAVFYLD